MKTKRLLGFFVFVTTMALTSCTQEQDYDLNAAKSITPTATENYQVSQEEAVAIATNAVISLGGYETRAGNTDCMLTVKNISRVPEQTRNTEQPETFFYVVNFEEGGYAVVPSDKRATSVYALSNEGYFSPDANDGVKLFMDMAEDYLKNEILVFDPDSIPLIHGGQFGDWEKIWGDDDMHNYPIINIGGHDCYDKVTRTQSTPFYLLETKWGQGYPYNNECFTDNGARAVTGCVATALAQIMAYHKQPQSYKGHYYYWDYMPQSQSDYDGSTEAYSVCYLMNDIGKAVSMNYGTDESGAYSKRCPFALSLFGYSCDGLNDYNASNIVTSLDNNMPVYLDGQDQYSGTGHAWVADGYYYIRIQHQYYSTENLSPYGQFVEMTYYFHMNWGWDGYGTNDNNGYYLSKVFNPEVGYYTYSYEDLNMICNIKYNR